MDHYSKVRARVGSARLMLSQMLRGPSRCSTSALQTTALVELLCMDAAQGLSSDQRALLGEQVVAAVFESDDEAKILEALTHGAVAGKGRRKSQDGMAFLQYISSNEWDRLALMRGKMEIANVLLSVLFDRLGFANMNELTKKFVASTTLLLATEPEMVDAITIDDKNAMKTWIARQCKYRADRGRFTKDCEYCTLLPYDPDILKQSHPMLYNKVHIDGCFVPVRLDQAALARIDNSYQCRNTLNAGKSHTVAMMSQMSAPNNMMQQAMMMMMSHLSSLQQSSQPGGIDLQFKQAGVSRKRGPAMLADVAGGAASSDLEMLTPDSRDQQLRRAITFDDSALEATAATPVLKAIATPLDVTPPPQVAASQVVTHQVAASQVVAPQVASQVVMPQVVMPQAELEVNEGKADNLLAALVARDAERATERKTQMAAARIANKAALVVAPVKQHPKAALVKLIPTPVKQVSKKTKKKSAGSIVSHEATRMQYLARTGCGPVGSKLFSYKHADQASAKASADEWLANYLAEHAK